MRHVFQWRNGASWETVASLAELARVRNPTRIAGLLQHHGRERSTSKQHLVSG
jgi:hypothetical protein